MTNASKTDWSRLAQLEDKDVDTSDIPELDETFFQKAELRVPAKRAVTIRLDSDGTLQTSSGPNLCTPCVHSKRPTP